MTYEIKPKSQFSDIPTFSRRSFLFPMRSLLLKEVLIPNIMFGLIKYVQLKKKDFLR